MNSDFTMRLGQFVVRDCRVFDSLERARGLRRRHVPGSVESLPELRRRDHIGPRRRRPDAFYDEQVWHGQHADEHERQRDDQIGSIGSRRADHHRHNPEHRHGAERCSEAAERTESGGFGPEQISEHEQMGERVPQPEVHGEADKRISGQEQCAQRGDGHGFAGQRWSVDTPTCERPADHHVLRHEHRRPQDPSIGEPRPARWIATSESLDDRAYQLDMRHEW